MRQRAILSAILAVLFASCSSTPELMKERPFARTVPYPELARRIDAMVPDSLFPPSQTGIMVYSLTRNESVYSLNPDLLFSPASNQKLFTAAAALDQFGSGFELATACYVAGDSALVIRGGGDPLLRTEQIDSIAAALARVLPANRRWRLSADIAIFDSIQWGKGWMWDDDPGGYVMRISPLCVNGNTAAVEVRPGATAGSRPMAAVDPSTRYVDLVNEARTGAGPDDSLSVVRTALGEYDRIILTGPVAIRRPSRRIEVSVSNPAIYWLTLLSERLEGYGIRTVIEGARGATPGQRAPVTTVRTPIDSAIVVMMKDSDNLAAEVLFRLTGYHSTGKPGSTENAAGALRRSLARLGVDTSSVLIADGSGVSRYNLASAASFVTLLTGVYERTDIRDLFMASLPVAGVDGTLKGRMKGTAAEGNLRAKTGTASGISALSGYVRTADGELLCFSILMGQYVTTATEYRLVQDRIGALLAAMRRSDF